MLHRMICVTSTVFVFLLLLAALSPLSIAKPRTAAEHLVPSVVSSVGLLVFAVTGSHATFFLRTLASLERFAPETFVAIIADKRVADELKNAFTTAPSKLCVRIYMFDALMRESSASSSSTDTALDRYVVLPLILKDFSLESLRVPRSSVAQLSSNTIFWESSSFISAAATTPVVAFAGICDGRDLIFQGDPFFPLREEALSASRAGKGVLAIALESQHVPIGSCPINRRWVATAFGEDSARAVASFRICNSGTLFGTLDALQDFVVSVVNPAFEWASKAARSGGFSLDQATLSFIGPAMFAALSAQDSKTGAGRLAAFSALSGPAEIVKLAHAYAFRNKILGVEAEGGWICTIGYFSNLGIEPVVDSAGNVMALWEPKTRCRIVHQFDRYPQLNEHITKLFEKKE